MGRVSDAMSRAGYHALWRAESGEDESASSRRRRHAVAAGEDSLPRGATKKAMATKVPSDLRLPRGPAGRAACRAAAT